MSASAAIPCALTLAKIEMNPIFNGIEKLINEHGSAVILKERLALASDKFEALESETRNTKKLLSDALLEIERLKSENQDLKAKIQEVEEKDGEKRKFSDITDQILQLIFEFEKDLPKEYISKKLNLKMGLVEYHFDQLLARSFIRFTRGATHRTPPCYNLTPEGRAYIVEKLHG